MEDQGYEESTITSNIKIGAGTIAVIAAVYSHFGPGQFPSNRPVVLACVVTYLLCFLLINASSFLLEASAIFVGTLTKRAKQVSNGTMVNKIWVRTSIGGKGSSAYRVEIRKTPRSKIATVTQAHPYEKYLTNDGAFLQNVFRADMKKLLSELKGSKKSN